MAYLIAYNFIRNDNQFQMVGQSVVSNPGDWIDRVQKYTDGAYVLINALEITDAQAKRWKGGLHGM